MQTEEASFVELQPLTEAVAKTTEVYATTSTVSAVLHSAHGIRIELYDNASSDFIRKILGALAYAE